MINALLQLMPGTPTGDLSPLVAAQQARPHLPHLPIHFTLFLGLIILLLRWRGASLDNFPLLSLAACGINISRHAIGARGRYIGEYGRLTHCVAATGIKGRRSVQIDWFLLVSATAKNAFKAEKGCTHHIFE